MFLWKLFLAGITTLNYCDDLHLNVLPYKYHSVDVTVVDSETGKPIPNAKVSVDYSGTYWPNEPKPDSAVTDAKGTAKVKAAVGISKWWAFCDCKGYITQLQSTTVDLSSTDFKLEKLPVVTLVVPDGYKGRININCPTPPVEDIGSTLFQDRIPEKKSKREYLFHANAKGEVNIELKDASFGLQYALSRAFLTARYENGRQIPAEDTEGKHVSEIALRHVATWFPC